MKVAEAGAGTRYSFRLDDEEQQYPDLVSRFQPDGSHGPSQAIDPGDFTRTDEAWRGIQIKGQVIYEIYHHRRF